MGVDWRWVSLPNVWWHPVSEVVIYDEDMPEELRPEVYA